MGATDGNFFLNCIAHSSSQTNMFAAGYSNSLSLVGSSGTNRAVIVELTTTPSVVNEWYLAEDNTAYHSCASNANNIAFISEYGDSLVSSDYFGTYSAFSFYDGGDNSYEGSKQNIEFSQAYIDSNGYLYFLLFPQVANSSRLLTIRVSVADPANNFFISDHFKTGPYRQLQSYSFSVLDPDPQVVMLLRTRQGNSSINYDYFYVSFDMSADAQYTWAIHLGTTTKVYLPKVADTNNSNGAVCIESEVGDEFLVHWWTAGATISDPLASTKQMTFSRYSAYNTNRCADIKINGSNVTFLVSVQSSFFQFLSVDITSSTFSSTRLPTYYSSNDVFKDKRGIIDLSGIYYHLTTDTKAGRKTYSNQVTIFHKADFSSKNHICYDSLLDSDTQSNVKDTDYSVQDLSASWTILDFNNPQKIGHKETTLVTIDSNPKSLQTSLLVDFDIEEPCLIEATITASSETLDEYTSGTFSITECEETSFCLETMTTTFNPALPSWLTYDDSNGQFTYTNANEETWTSTMGCEMESSEIETSSQTVTVSDNPLSFDSCSDQAYTIQQAGQSDAFTLSYSNSDPAGTASYTAIEQGQAALPSFVTDSTATNTLTLTYDLSDCTDAGTHTIEINAQDTDTGATAQCVFDIVLTNFNAVPDLASAPTDQSYQVTTGAQQFTLPDFDDPDSGDTFTTYFTVNGQPSASFPFITLANLNEFTVNSNDNADKASYTIEFFFEDDNSCGAPGGTESNSYTFTLDVTSFNHPPSITSINDVSLFRYEASEVQTFTISDLDSATDTFTIAIKKQSDGSVVNSPAFSLDLSNRPCISAACSLTVNPSYEAQRGSYSLQLCVEDNDSVGQGSTKSDCANFDVTLTVFNRVPTITPIADVDIFKYEGSLTQTFTVADDDAADTLTLSLRNQGDDLAALSPPFTIDRTNYPCKVSPCTVTADPSNESLKGTYDLKLCVTDNDTEQEGSTKEACSNFQAILKVFNRVPTITAINDVDRYKYEGAVVQTFTVADQDAADTLTITLKNRADDTEALNPPFTLDLSNQPCKSSACSVMADPSDESLKGTYELKLCVEDNDTEGEGVTKEACSEFDAILKVLNREPTISALSNHDFDVYDAMATQSFTANDDDVGDSLTFTLRDRNTDLAVTLSSIYLDLTNYPCSSTGCDLVVDPQYNPEATTYELKVCAEDDDTEGEGVQKEVCADFDIEIRPTNTAPTWAQPFSTKTVNNYESLTFNLPNCEDIDPNDVLTATYEYTKTGGGTSSSLDFVTESSSGNGKFRLKIEPYEIPQVGQYQTCVTCGDDDSVNEGIELSLQQCFFFQVRGINHPPQWQSDFADVEIFDDETYQYYLPLYKDEDPGDSFTEIIDYDGAGSFITLTSDSLGTQFEIKIAPTSVQQTGVYNLKFTIEDSDSELSGTRESISGGFTLTINNSTYYDPEAGIGAGDSSNSSGSTEIDYFTLMQNLNVAEGSQAPTPEISAVSANGIVTITWSEPVYMLTNMTQFIEKGAVQVQVNSQYAYGEDILNGFDVVAIDSRNFEFRLNFTDSSLISRYKSQDEIEIIFLEEFYFVAQASNQTLAVNTIIKAKLPPQTESNNIQALMSTQDALKQIINSILTGNWVLNLFMSASMNLLWNMLNSLQVIVTLPMLNLKFPDNAFIISQNLNNVANFNVFHIEDYTRLLLDFDSKSKARNMRFREYSYETSNFILNSEILFYAFVLYIVFAGFTSVLSKFFDEDSKIGRKVYEFYEMFYFNILIRLMLEGYLEFILCAIVNMQQLLWSKSGEILSSFLSIVFFFLCLAMPLYTHFIITKYRYKLHYPRFKNKYGEFYHGLKLNNPHIILFNVYFVLRRLFLVTSLVYFENITLQISIINTTSLAMLAYLFILDPYQNKTITLIEIVNEGVVLLCTYFCWFFTDHLEDLKIKNFLGWAYCFILGAMIAFNLTYMLYVSIFQAIRYYLCPSKKQIEKKKQVQYEKDFSKRQEDAMKKLEQEEEDYDRQQEEKLRELRFKANTRGHKQNDSISILNRKQNSGLKNNEQSSPHDNPYNETLIPILTQNNIPALQKKQRKFKKIKGLNKTPKVKKDIDKKVSNYNFKQSQTPYLRPQTDHRKSLKKSQSKNYSENTSFFEKRLGKIQNSGKEQTLANLMNKGGNQRVKLNFLQVKE